MVVPGNVVVEAVDVVDVAKINYINIDAFSIVGPLSR